MNIANVQIARVCHETNRAYCEAIGDFSQVPWNLADRGLRDSSIKSVEFALQNPDAPASAQHDEWMADKITSGWTYGPEKDAAKKTHPCIVPYDQLPVEQRLKDYLFRAAVKAFVEAGAVTMAQHG